MMPGTSSPWRARTAAAWTTRNSSRCTAAAGRRAGEIARRVMEPVSAEEVLRSARALLR